MTHKERACVTGAVVGAALGATLAYLYATDEGSQRRDRVWSGVNRLRRDAREARQLWHDLVDVWVQFQHDRDTVVSSMPQRRWPSGDVA